MADSNPVFVVDDDTSARSGLARLLRAAGHEVHPFSSGEELLAALNSNCLLHNGIVGCMVLDLTGPGLLGIDLASELGRQGFHLPIIVLTASDNVATRQQALSMNAVGFFRKPIDGVALLDAVEWAHQSYDVESLREDWAR